MGKSTKKGPQPRALRYNQGKPWLSRILCFPAALSGVAKVTEFGERKYAQYNFTKGAPLSESLDCLLRHVLRYWCRVEIDPETDLMELNAAAWNALRATDESQRRPAGFVDDRPPPGTYDPEQIIALLGGMFPGQMLQAPAPSKHDQRGKKASTRARNGRRNRGNARSVRRPDTRRR